MIVRRDKACLVSTIRIIGASWWIALIIILIAGNVAIQLEPVGRLDRKILEWFDAGRTVTADRFVSCVTWLGSTVILLPLMLTQTVILMVRSRIREALFLAGSFVGASVLGYIVKFIIARPRPNLFPAVIDIPAGFSFPSSHAAQITAFVLAELLVYNITRGTRWFILLQVLCGVLILLVSISRLYLQVHYPTDVVAGFLMALCWVLGLAALMLDKQYRAGNIPEKP